MASLTGRAATFTVRVSQTPGQFQDVTGAASVELADGALVIMGPNKVITALYAPGEWARVTVVREPEK